MGPRSLTTRTVLALLLLAAPLAAISGYQARRYFDAMSNQRAFERTYAPHAVGWRLPDARLWEVSGSPKRMSEIVPASDTFVLAAFRPGCRSCVGEAAKWQHLSVQYPRIAFIGVALDTNSEFLSELRRDAKVQFNLVLADAAVGEDIRAKLTPTIYVASPEREILFSAAGEDATLLLERFLTRLFD